MRAARLAGDLARTAGALARSGLLGPFLPRPALLRVGAALPLGGVTAGTGVAYQAATRPRAPALADDRGELTWRELDERTSRLAGALRARAPEGGRVVLLVRNGREAVEGIAGASRAGLAAVPVSTEASAADLVISGGENVHPAEVEAVLEAHPDVGEVAVVGVDDEEWGQVLHAHVVARPGAEPTPEALLDHARAGLARFKVPKQVVLRGSLPRNAAGKVVKREP